MFLLLSGFHLWTCCCCFLIYMNCYSNLACRPIRWERLSSFWLHLLLTQIHSCLGIWAGNGFPFLVFNNFQGIYRKDKIGKSKRIILIYRPMLSLPSKVKIFCYGRSWNCSWNGGDLAWITFFLGIYRNRQNRIPVRL